jgi:cell division protein FtsI/penicillin-binding protein 2
VPDSRRSYPQGQLATQLIGAVGIDGQGLTGLEAAYDDQLSGSDGELELVRDALGEEISRDVITEAVPGEDIRLTIDAKIQARTEQALRRIARNHTPAGAVAIAMNPRNGEILALANWPSAKLSDIGAASEAELLNRATGFTYEPGSTFKAFTVAAALEEDLVTPETQFNLGSTIQVADREIGEAHDFGGGTLTTAEILKQSSNVGAVTIGLEVGDERMSEWIGRFGFGEPTGVDLPGEEQGIVPEFGNPDEWSGSTIGNLPIGQGLSVTPMQMAVGYSAIANGGFLRSPHVVDAVDGEATETEGRRVITRRHSRQLTDMLEGVFAPGGTASEVSVPGYNLAGKTGTAEKVVDGLYSETDFVGSFVGFAPTEDPQLLVTVAVDVPQNGYYGGTVAAPAFGEIASFALPYLGIQPS